MLLLPKWKQVPRSCSLPSMVSRASCHWASPRTLMLPSLQSLSWPGIEILVFGSNLKRSSHFGLKITKYKSSKASNLRPLNSTLQVPWLHRSCALLTSTRRPLRRKSYSELPTLLLLPSTHIPGTGSWTKQFVIVSSSIFRAQSSSTMLRRLEFIIASGWLLYISAVLPASAQMCLNWEAGRIRNCLGQPNFWLKMSKFIKQQHVGITSLITALLRCPFACIQTWAEQCKAPKWKHVHQPTWSCFRLADILLLVETGTCTDITLVLIQMKLHICTLVHVGYCSPRLRKNTLLLN